jgi:hypothetical protein
MWPNLRVLFLKFHWVGWHWVHLVLRTLIGLLYQLRMIHEYGALGGMRIGRGNRSTRRKPAPVSTTNPTRLDLGSNQGSRGVKPAANRLSYGTAWRYGLLSWHLPGGNKKNVKAVSMRDVHRAEILNWGLPNTECLPTLRTSQPKGGLLLALCSIE